MDVYQFLEKLNSEQKKAVLHKSGPAIVLAGAGSGKTRVLTTKAALILKENEARFDQITLLTFTNKAANQMKEKIRSFTGFDIPYAGTFHHIGALILRKYSHLIGINNNFIIYDSDDQNAVIKNVLKQLGITGISTKKAKNSILELKNSLISPDDFSDFASSDYDEKIYDIYKQYEKNLKKANALDFSDLLTLSFKIVKEKDIPFNKNLKYILVDEYQDTNLIQYLLIKEFAKYNNNIYVVGDFSQSIYAWRGADYRNIKRLYEDFKDIKEYRLTQNYRSTKTILKAASSLIKHNTSHPILELWTTKQQDNKIEVYEASDDRQEAKIVSDIISQLIFNGWTYKDIAILYRTNSQSRQFEEAFIRNSIPYKIYGGVKFYSRKEIKDVLAYLKVYFNPFDEISLKRVKSLGKRRYTNFVKNIVENPETKKMSPFELLEAILEATSYTDKYDKKDNKDLARLENIEELKNYISRFDNLSSFLEKIALVEDADTENIKNIGNFKDQVSLMSFHAAKGLEFPIVFLVGFEEGLLPHTRSMDEFEKLEEERRLCYVGITRAKEKLFITYAKARWQQGRLNITMPSRFLSEMDNQLFIYKNTSYDSINNTNTFTTYNNDGGRKIISDDELDAFLNGEIKVDDFI